MGIDGAEIKRKNDKLDILMAEKKAAAEEKKRKDEEAGAASEMFAKQFEEERAAREAEEIERRKIERKRSVISKGLPVLDCAACKNEKSMIATSIPRFGSFIRFIGYLIAAPSVLGFLFSILTFLSSIAATSDISAKNVSQAYHAGVVIGGTIGIVGSMVFGGASLIGGLVGYLLLTKKKVFKCRICGYILDRA